MNLHSYKYSGLANSKTVHIGQATKKSGHATAVLALKVIINFCTYHFSIGA
jgi:hypothetical protein